MFCNDHKLVWDFGQIKDMGCKDIVNMGLHCDIDLWLEFINELKKHKMNIKNIQISKKGLLTETRQYAAMELAAEMGLNI